MGLYGFKKRFVPMILDGSKRHTIRDIRKNADRPGKVMHLYTGLRQKGATLLFRAPCVKVEDIEIVELPGIFLDHAGPVVRVNGEALSSDECNALAWRDGFRGSGLEGAFLEMMQFWDGRLPFTGHLYHWDYDRRQS